MSFGSPAFNILTAIFGMAVFFEVLVLIRRKPPGIQTLLDELHKAFMANMIFGLAIYIVSESAVLFSDILGISGDSQSWINLILIRILVWVLFDMAIVFCLWLIICALAKFILISRPHWLLHISITDREITKRITIVIWVIVFLIMLMAEVKEELPIAYLVRTNQNDLIALPNFARTIRSLLTFTSFFLQIGLWAWVCFFYLDGYSEFKENSNEIITNQCILVVAAYQFGFAVPLTIMKKFELTIMFMTFMYTLIFPLALIQFSTVLRLNLQAKLQILQTAIRSLPHIYPVST